MSAPKETRTITLGYRQWTYLAVVALVVLPIVLIAAFLPQLQTAYVRQFSLPEWERRFGFQYGAVRLPTGAVERDVFAVVQVSPGGVFDRAGIVSGDVPVGYHHGFESGFYHDLAQLESGVPTTLHVLNAHTGARRTVVVTPW